MRPLLLVLLSAALLAGCGASAAPAAAPTTEPAPTTPAPAASTPAAAPQPSGSTTPAAPATATRTVYWLGAGEDPRGPRLYRELLPAPDTGDAVRDAVTRMLDGAPLDPDYDSLWADGTRLLSVQREGTTAVVDLSSEATANGGGSAFEAMTVQQLVHTVTAAEPSLQAVQLLVEGQPVETLWGAVDLRRPVRRSPAAETLGPVWLDVPEGGAVDGTFGGSATVFEATVSWELRSGEEVVEEGFATATTGAPERGEWTATTQAPPGDYELWAFESSAKDGSTTWVDSKRVTVR
jgi:spore germination protein GerM